VFVRKRQASSVIAVDRENEDAVVGKEPFQLVRPGLLLFGGQVREHRNGIDGMQRRGNVVFHELDAGESSSAPS